MLVIEVARTSVRTDRKKAAAYARAGVETYWLINLVSLQVEVHAEPHADGRYALVRVLAPDDEVELPYAAIKWPAARLLPADHE